MCRPDERATSPGREFCRGISGLPRCPAHSPPHRMVIWPASDWKCMGSGLRRGRDHDTRLTLPNGRGGPALQICPSEDTAVLRKALGGRWHYAVTRNGTVIRDLPAKPNHPFEDAGDAVAYFASGIAPSRAAVEKKPPPRAPLKYGRILGAFDYELGPGGVNGR